MTHFKGKSEMKYKLWVSKGKETIPTQTTTINHGETIPTSLGQITTTSWTHHLETNNKEETNDKEWTIKVVTHMEDTVKENNKVDINKEDTPKEEINGGTTTTMLNLAHTNLAVT